jgi:hypothetical protein
LIKTEHGFASEADLEFTLAQYAKDLIAGLLFFVDLQCKKPHLGQKVLRVQMKPLQPRYPFQAHRFEAYAIFHEFADGDALRKKIILDLSIEKP